MSADDNTGRYRGILSDNTAFTDNGSGMDTFGRMIRRVQPGQHFGECRARVIHTNHIFPSSRFSLFGDDDRSGACLFDPAQAGTFFGKGDLALSRLVNRSGPINQTFRISNQLALDQFSDLLQCKSHTVFHEAYCFFGFLAV
jgi:hypothetical protein